MASQWVSWGRDVAWVAAVLVALSGCTGSGRIDAPPASGTSTTSAPSGPIDVTQTRAVPLGLRGLPTGEEPAVAWLEGDWLVTDRSRVPVPDAGEARAVAPYGSGAIVETWGRTLRWRDASGRLTRTLHHAEGLGWSARLGQVAWWEGGSRRIVVASSVTGRVVARVPAPVALANPLVVGWLGPADPLVASGLLSVPGPVWEVGQQPLVGGSGRPFAASEVSGKVATGVLRERSDIACLLLSSSPSPDPEGQPRCLVRQGRVYSAQVGEFSPDGRLLLIRALSPIAGARPFVVVVDVASGDPRALFDEGRYGSDRDGAQYDVLDVAFEDDQHVLLVVRDRTGQRPGQARQAIIRCDIASLACELATTPRTWTASGRRPYDLAG